MSEVRVDTPANAAKHLADDEVHVWQLRYDRRRGRAPLHALLGAYLETDPAAIALDEGTHGRPMLAAPHALGFNWSHSGELALVALARELEPGIDLERLRPRPRAMEIAARYFAPAEVAGLAALEMDAREHAFLGLWTAKEGVLKAQGRGLAFGLHRLAIAPGGDTLRWMDEEHVGDWQLMRLQVDAAHLAALAWRGPPRRIRQWVLAEDG